MGTARPAGLALVAFLLLFWSAFAPAVGQDPDGRMVVAADYELFGTSDLNGGGHVTWTLTGAKASELRAKILHMFDEYGEIPRGFPIPNVAIPRNRDGRLDAVEGIVYTDRLERLLEGSSSPFGTDVAYLELFPFDLRESGAGRFERSTSGLADTDLNSTADVQIRFLFEAATTTRDARVRLSTAALAQALDSFFAYEAAQSPTPTTGLYPWWWPFLKEGGWHNVTVGGREALTHRNESTGVYDDDTVAIARTFADPVLAAADPLSDYTSFDLRFASRAWATFNYTGQVADLDDRLRLEIARGPAFTDWTALSFGASVDLPTTDVGDWSNASVDLTSYLGERVRLRFNFTSNATGNGPGFFFRDFAFHAPSFYEGEVVQSDVHYLVGTLSFSEPSLASGGMHLIRTPGGEILSYTSTWDAGALSEDTIRFRTFDVTENPQVLFGIMIVASYVIARMQDDAYDRFRETHPRVYRPAVHKAKWLHRVGRVAIGLLVLFYFVPTALWLIGLRIFVSGPAYWLLAMTLALLVGFGTRAYYRGKVEEAPPPVLGEEAASRRQAASTQPSEVAAVAHCTQCLAAVHEGEPTYDCSCGAVYHERCAAGLMRCSNCRKPVALEVVRVKKQVSMRCESCGELQAVPEGGDPRAITCANCGARLRHLDEGKRYLIVANNPDIAFVWIRDLTKGGKPSLCLTPAAPERLRLEFGVKDVQILQVASQGSTAVDPKKLDPAGLKAILPLAREGKGGVILYDGLERIIQESSMGDLIRFLRKANDMAFVHGVTVIARVAPGSLPDAEMRRLRSEFDEYLDLSAHL